MTPPRRCQVCERSLCGRGPAKTGLCADCRSAAARFVRNWCVDLRSAGVRDRQVADIVGIPFDAVRSRRSEALR
jgi:hypothetical protein